MDKINSQLDELRKKYPDQESMDVLNQWEKEAKIAVVTANLQENDAMKLIIAQYQKELASLRKMLAEEKSLFQDEKGMQLGLMIHERIDWCRKFLNIFIVAKSRVANVDKQLENLTTEE